MIFTKNSLATEKCDCQYKSSFKKNAFEEEDDINLPTEKDQNSVRETPTLGQSFLICVFPIFFSIQGRITFCHPYFKTGALPFSSINICSFF